MNKDLIIQQVLSQLQHQAAPPAVAATQNLVAGCGMTEFVGVGLGDTLGLVIANLDASIHDKLGIDKKYRSLGIISSRSAVGPQAMGADEAVKSSNSELLIFNMPRDTKTGGGHGILLVFGAEEVSDARRAVEITLKSLEWSFGETYMNEAGHCEIQYSARAGQALQKFLGAELGKAWGILCGCPAGVGMLMADKAVKSADVTIAMHATPAVNTSFSNEFMIMVTGDSSAVKQAVLAARETGIQLLSKMGPAPASVGGTPYIY